MVAYGLAEEPNPIADVAGLVVVNLRVTLGEPGQQPFALEVLHDELEGRETERGLQDQVVQGDEADLCREVAGLCHQALVRLDQRHVKDSAKGRGKLPPRAIDMLGNGGGSSNDIVLKACVELHVASLVDLLRGEKSRLLLGSVGSDQTGELRRDSLLGDHERGEHPVDQPLIVGIHLRPLLLVRGQIDVERAPLRVLPPPVERFGIVELVLLDTHEGSLARTIAELAWA